MSVLRKHGPYAVSIGATLLGGITRQNLVTGAQVQGEATSGEIYDRFAALYAAKVAPSFSTLNVAAALAACGALGTNIGGLTGGLSLYAQQHAAGGTRTTGATHRKFNFTAGILYPKSLSVSHRGDATLEYDAVVTYDGTNLPVVVTDSFALPTGLTDAERFTLGPIALGGTAFSENMSLQIDFGLDVVGESADSDIYDTLASIRAQNSTLTFKGLDLQWFGGNVPLVGQLLGTSNTTIFLRKRAAGGTYVADATAQHLKFVAQGMLYCDTILDSDTKKAAEVGLKLKCTYDGTNAPLAITTASAIA